MSENEEKPRSEELAREGQDAPLEEGEGNAPASEEAKPKKSRIPRGPALREALNLIYERRGRLAIGFSLMLVSRISGLIMPLLPKGLIDWVIGGECEQLANSPWTPDLVSGWMADRPCADLLTPLALTGGAATLIQAATSFGLTLILGVAAQRSITEMRKRIEQHVTRLPVSYFDSHKSGEMISRVMTDAEGIRNLIGTGLVQLIGGLVTASLALSLLLLLNWKLTVAVLAVLLSFAVGTAFSFTWLRPIFRMRGKINAEVTGRLGELLGGVRLVKAYTAEKREDLVFAKGVHRLFRNVAKTMVGVASVTTFSTAVVGIVGMMMVWIGGRAILADTMTVGDFMTYVLLTGMVAAPLIQISAITTQLSEAFAGLDRIREVLSLDTEDDADEERRRVAGLGGEFFFRVPGGRLRVRAGGARAPSGFVPGTRGLDHRPRRSQRLRQEHAHEPGDGLQPTPGWADPGRRREPRRAAAQGLPSAPGSRLPGQLPLRWNDRREHLLRPAGIQSRGRGGRRGRGARG